MTPALPQTDRADLRARAVVVADSPEHHLMMCVRSLEASVARAGITLFDVEIVRPVATTGRLDDNTTRSGADLLVVLSSSSLVSDDFVAVASDLLCSSPHDWVFPELVGDLVRGMSGRVIRVEDTARTPSTRWDFVDGVRYPRCVILADDGAAARQWSTRIEPENWPGTVLDHLGDGNQLRVASDSLLLVRSASDLGELEVPDRRRIVALADHRMFASDSWADRSRSPQLGEDKSDWLGRALHSVRETRLSGVLERRRVVGARAAVRGAMNEWLRTVATAPATLSTVPGLVESVAQLNEIDPQVHPMVLKSMVPDAGIRSWTADHFHQFLERFGDRTFTDVFVRPTFPVGGTENVILDITSALAAAGSTSLIVVTDASSSPLESRIKRRDGVDLWAIGADSRGVPDADVAHLIGIVLARTAPQTLSVCDSERGFQAWFHARSQLVRTGTMLIYQDYSLPKLDGIPYEHVASAPDALMDASLVITDSVAYERHLMTTYGLGEDRFLVLPHPVLEVAQQKRSGVSRRVLWMGRLSAEKCPEVAIGAVASLGGRTVEMDMYGPWDDAHAAAIDLNRLLAEAPNVRYRGVFGSLSEIDFDRYDALVMPSMQEGLPHAAIEAVFANLFLIVADVGGLPEAVASATTGMVVTGRGALAFADAIERFYADESLHDPVARRAANAHLRDWHTNESFIRQVRLAYRPER